MSVDMYLVSIVTRQEKLLPLMDGLDAIGVKGLTVTPVEGFGTQLGVKERYRGVETEIHMLPKILVETVVSKVPVDSVVKTATEILYTGEPGDGKLSVSRITKVVRIRTGETDREALKNPDETE
jgi:nitrogen regulatory protein PII